MRLRTGWRPEDWIDTGPGYGGSVRLGGELVIGSPGPVASQRRNQKKYTAEQRALAYLRTKRYRERQRDAA